MASRGTSRTHLGAPALQRNWRRGWHGEHGRLAGGAWAARGFRSSFALSSGHRSSLNLIALQPHTRCHRVAGKVFERWCNYAAAASLSLENRVAMWLLCGLHVKESAAQSDQSWEGASGKIQAHTPARPALVLRIGACIRIIPATLAQLHRRLSSVKRGVGQVSMLFDMAMATFSCEHTPGAMQTKRPKLTSPSN